jgi:hypothetical protein
MANITIGDFTGEAELQVADASLFGKGKLKSLQGPAQALIASMPKVVANSAFKSATLGASFDDPSLAVPGGKLEVKAGINATLSLTGSAGGPLFGNDDYDPVPIHAGDCWLTFKLDAQTGGGITAPLPSGFGVCFADTAAASFSVSHLIPQAAAASESLEQAIAETLDVFTLADSAQAVLAVPDGVIWTSDLSGSIKVGGSWSLPLAVNQLSLADANLPFNQTIKLSPAATVKVAGDVVLSSGFGVRVHRTGTASIRLGVYRKHGSQLDVSLKVAAGLKAGLDGADLIGAFFNAVAPGTGKSVLSPADQTKIQKVLNDSIDRSLSISLNAACAASSSDEAAIVYEIDTTLHQPETAAAIESALHGDWTLLAALPNATKLRNLVVDTIERKYSLCVNVLGIFNYRSVEDFLRTLRILHNEEDGSVTLTDTVTASQIATSSTPLASDADQLRRALYESFLATATYKALLAGVGVTPQFSAKQEFFLYHDTLGYRSALKQLNTGEALGLMPLQVKTALPPVGGPVRHARFAATSAYDDSGVLHLFFSDIEALKPWQLEDLKRTGRQVLASLLDPQDPVDVHRIQILQSDQQWEQLDAHPAAIKPPAYSDWFDITLWAEAVAKVGPLLAAAIQSGKSVGGDPSANPDFIKKRASLAQALDSVTHNLKAAFEPSFPICVMATLCSGPSSGKTATFDAEWNGKKIFG